jgi:hypothetical protein
LDLQKMLRRSGQLSAMAQQAQTAMASEDLSVVADRGYYKSEKILACEEAGIIPYVPKAQTSGNQAKGLFGRNQFHYDAVPRRRTLKVAYNLTGERADVTPLLEFKLSRLRFEITMHDR